jgi:hypothetical protein
MVGVGSRRVTQKLKFHHALNFGAIEGGSVARELESVKTQRDKNVGRWLCIFPPRFDSVALWADFHQSIH